MIFAPRLPTSPKENERMKKLKIYLDSSVISLLDQKDSPERMAYSHQLWDKIKAGKF
jgi:hypothetical protein